MFFYNTVCICTCTFIVASNAMILKLKEELCQQEEEIEILKTRLKKQSQRIHTKSTSPSIQSEQPLNIEVSLFVIYIHISLLAYTQY